MAKKIQTLLKKEPQAIYKKFLDEAVKQGYDHSAINQIVGVERQAVLTKAEVQAGLNFSNWVMEDIGQRYEIIGGKTWNFTTSKGIVLIPKNLAEERLGLNRHLWNKEGYNKV